MALHLHLPLHDVQVGHHHHQALHHLLNISKYLQRGVHRDHNLLCCHHLHPQHGRGGDRLRGEPHQRRCLA